MKCARWSCQRAVGPARHPAPLAARRSASADFGRRAGDGGRAVEVGGGRARVLEHAARSDAQVRLVVVAEHDAPRARRVVGELDRRAEVDDLEREPGHRRASPAASVGLVVRRLRGRRRRGRRAGVARDARRTRTTSAHDQRATAREHAAACGSSGLGVAHRRRRRCSRAPRDARADGADRHAADLGGLRVRAADDLREHERGALVVVERSSTSAVERVRAARVGRRCLAAAVAPRRARRVGEPAAAHRARGPRRRTPGGRSTSSQVRALESPRNAGSARHARTNVSWVTSSASSGPTRWRGEAPHVGLAARGPRAGGRCGRRRVRRGTAASARPPLTDDTGGTSGSSRVDYLV